MIERLQSGSSTVVKVMNANQSQTSEVVKLASIQQKRLILLILVLIKLPK